MNNQDSLKSLLDDFTYIIDPFNTALDSLDKIGALEAVRNKLVNSPDKAKKQLQKALKEINNIYLVLADLVVDFQSLSFDTPDERNDSVHFLGELLRNKRRIEIETARGHCSIVTNVYDRYLQGWFSRVLNPTEAAEISSLFTDLEGVDYNVCDALDQFVRVTRGHAQVILEHMNQNDYKFAEMYVAAITERLRKQSDRTFEYLKTLMELQRAFTEKTGAI